MIRFVIFTLLLLPHVASAAVFHVSTTGTKTSGESVADNWSNANCYGSIESAIAEMSTGDTVLVNDGVYALEDGNSIDRSKVSIPSGASRNQFTTIKARNRLKVRIEANDVAYYDYFVRLPDAGQYIHVDGFHYVLEDSTPSRMYEINGSYNKVTNSIGIRKGAADNYCSAFAINGHHNLVEDCAATGHGRYLFTTGGTTSTDQYNIFRRCVARFDYSDSNQPMAPFAFYGNNSGTGTNNMRYQNCIVVDSQQADTGEGIYSYVWSGFYFPKNAFQAKIQGSIVLNSDVRYGAYAPIEMSGGEITVEDSVAWNISNSMTESGYGLNWRGSGNAYANHLTIGASDGSLSDNNSGTNVVKNSLFWLNSSMGSYGVGTMTHNAFNPEGQADGTDTVSADTMSYITRIDSGTTMDEAGDDGSDIGANIIFRYGGTGTFYGEPGFDAVSNQPLWPWPNDNAIRDAFAEVNNPNSGATPSTNDTTRGFTDTPYDHTDYPLTEYIWEYLGNEIGNTNEEIESFDFAAGYIPGTTICYLDADGDGYSDGTSETTETCSVDYFIAEELTAISGDCDDSNPDIHPGAPDIPGNNIDEDCNGSDNTVVQQPRRLKLVN